MTNKVNGAALLRLLAHAHTHADDRETFRNLVGNIARYEVGWQTPSDARRHLDDHR